jgi:hypothetical protein
MIKTDLFSEANKLRSEGLTIRDIASRLNVSKSTIHNWTCKTPEERKRLTAQRMKTYYEKHGRYPGYSPDFVKSRLLIKQVKEYYQCQNPSCNWTGKLPSCCLHFHHKGDKKFNIGNVVGAYHSYPEYEAEIEKCIVLCPTCHHLERFGMLDVSSIPCCKVDYSFS